MCLVHSWCANSRSFFYYLPIKAIKNLSGCFLTGFELDPLTKDWFQHWTWGNHMVESNLGSCFDRLLTESYALHLYPCRNKKNNRLQIWSHPLSPLILLFWKHRLFVQQIIVEAVSGWANFRSVRKRHGHDYVITRDQKSHLLQVSCVRLKTVKSHSVRALKKTNRKKIGNCCMHFAQIVWLRCEIVGFRREINQKARPVFL